MEDNTRVIFVYVENVDETQEMGIANGAELLIPARDQFWGDRIAWFMDPAGHVWTIAADRGNRPPGTGVIAGQTCSKAETTVKHEASALGARTRVMRNAERPDRGHRIAGEQSCTSSRAVLCIHRACRVAGCCA